MEAAAAAALEEAVPEAAISLGGPPAAATVAGASSPWDQSLPPLNSISEADRGEADLAKLLMNSDRDPERRTPPQFEPGQMPLTDSDFGYVRCCNLQG